MDHPPKSSHCVHTAKSGNPRITVVHQSGIFDMEILYCICSNAVNKDEQLMNAGLFPSSFKQIETAVTFAVLDVLCPDRDTLLDVSTRYLWVQWVQWFNSSRVQMRP